jgi:hypothetical protein
MDIHRDIYEFAASAGALEGYLYHRNDVDLDPLLKWIDNLVAAYKLLPSEALDRIQPSVDQTVGRAIRSVIAMGGGDHEVVTRLKSMVAGEMPESPDDFQKKKWFQS